MKNFFHFLKKPFVIAEVGVNHECSLIKAKKLIDLAKLGGADAVKFQTYKAENLAIQKSRYYWDIKKEKEKTQFSLFKKFDKFEKKDFIKLAKYSQTKKIVFLSTPFDFNSVDFLNPLMPFFKVASADITNFPLLEKIASKKKPILLSTGASNVSEINKAYNFLKEKKCKNIAIMHCVLSYPTKNNDANLSMIQYLKKKFPYCEVGYSDHTIPDKNMLTLTSAYLLGANIIEKHFTDNKKKKGNDHYHSMDFKDLKYFKNILNQISILKGSLNKKAVLQCEKKSRKFARRSIVAKIDLKKNIILRNIHLDYKRPGLGISPANYKKILGMRTRKKIKYDQIIKFKDLK